MSWIGKHQNISIYRGNDAWDNGGDEMQQTKQDLQHLRAVLRGVEDQIENTYITVLGGGVEHRGQAVRQSSPIETCHQAKI